VVVVASVHHQQRPAGELTNGSARIDEGAHNGLEGRLTRKIPASGQSDRADCWIVGRDHDRQIGAK